MSHARRIAIAVGCGLLLVPAVAAEGRDRVTFYPGLSAAPKLHALKAGSGLQVLLPEVMHLHDLTDGRRAYHLRAHATSHSYDLFLVNARCPKAAPCRRIARFSAVRTADAPSGNLALAKGRKGFFTLGSCTGGGCTPPSITWIERGARYSVYAYASRRRLLSYVKQAILTGGR
ncbi:MAG: hypothetical protein JWM73_1557 [Solirubrobacterales bacterium]|nr:hypothetical protein [Solirubrobacterales bacterium]